MTDRPALRPRAERCPDPTCTDEQQCWRCDAEEAQHVGARAAAELDTARRRAVALVERIDAGRAWARRNLTPEQQAGLFAALRGNAAPRTVLDVPAGPPAIDLIRASVTAREQKADEAHEAGNYRTANEHNAIATGLRIAEAHILAAIEPPKEQP